MCLSTLAFLPGAMNRFTLPKLCIAALAIGIGALAQRRGKLPREVIGLLVAGAAVLVFAAVMGNAPEAALLGRWPRYEGVVTLGIYVGAAWLGARLLHTDSAAHRNLEVAIAVVATVLFVESVAEELGMHPLGVAEADRTGGLLGNATDLGLIAMIAAAMLLRPAIVGRLWWAGVGTIAAIGTVALSGSRAAILGTLVAIGCLALTSASIGLRRGALLAFGAMIAAVAVVPTARDRLFSGDTVAGRELLWRESLNLIRDHPLTGVGPSGFFDAIPQYHFAAWIRDVGPANPPDSPHMWILQAAAVGGLPLLLIALSLAVVIAHRALTAVREAEAADHFPAGAAAAGLAYATALLTHFTTAGTTPLAAFLIGGLVAVSAKQTQTQVHRVAAVSLAAIGAVWAGTAVVAEVDLHDGITAAAAGDPLAADEAFRSAQKWRAWDTDIAMLAATALAANASNGDKSAIMPTLRWADQSLAAVPGNRGAGLAKGVALIAKGDLAGAQSVLSDVIESAPTEPQAYIQRALARFGSGEFQGALIDLAVAEKLDPKDPTPDRIRAEILARIRAQR